MSSAPKKILIVDDSKDNRVILARMLEFGGFEVVAAKNGQEALSLARDTSPDLILMDLAMPEMDGWTATEEFKRQEDLSQIPIIVVTGHVTSDEIRRAQEVGCQDVVSKPIDYYVLINKVREHLSP